MPRLAIIGSRKIPDWLDDQIELMSSHYVLDHGCTIVTGGAPGTDQASIRGAAGNSKVWLPWKAFESASLTAEQTEVTPHGDDPAFIALLEFYYDRPAEAISRGTYKLMARNYTIVMDSDAIIAFPRMKDGNPAGGTAFGIFLAGALNKPCKVIPLDSLDKWDICKSCGMHQQLWRCGSNFHNLKPYV